MQSPGQINNVFQHLWGAAPPFALKVQDHSIPLARKTQPLRRTNKVDIRTQDHAKGLANCPQQTSLQTPASASRHSETNDVAVKEHTTLHSAAMR